MNDAEKVRQQHMPYSQTRGVITDAVAKDWKWAAEHHKDYGTWPIHAVLSLLACRDSILTELAEAKEREEQDVEVVRRLDEEVATYIETLLVAEERAEKAEALCEMWGQILKDSPARDARIQTLEAENDRLRQGLVEALEEQP